MATMSALPLAPPTPGLPSYSENDTIPSSGSTTTTPTSTSTSATGKPSSRTRLPPTTLHVAGRFIHHGDPQAPPLYELSHSVGFLKDSDRTVRLERLDYSVRDQKNKNDNSRNSSAGEPRVVARRHQLFDLKHPTAATGPTFEYHGQATSRRAACSFGVTSARAHRGLLLASSARTYRVHRATQAPDRRMVQRGLMFAAAPPSGGSGGGGGGDGAAVVVMEWRDAAEGGQLVAREVCDGPLRSLVVGVEMEAGERDVLVAAWITRVWWELAREGTKGKILEDGEYSWTWQRAVRC